MGFDEIMSYLGKCITSQIVIVALSVYPPGVNKIVLYCIVSSPSPPIKESPPAERRNPPIARESYNSRRYAAV